MKDCTEKLKFRKYKNSDQLCELVHKKSEFVILSFSGGKDSLCSWFKLLNFWPKEKIIPVFFYYIPGLKFVEEKIQYFEKFFDTKIIRLPHKSIINNMIKGLFQNLETTKILIDVNLPYVSHDYFTDAIKEDYNLPKETYVAVGIRATDNLQRWTAFVTHGAMNENRYQFWPIFDYTLDDLESLLRSKKIKMCNDYKLFGKTFDSLQYRYIKPIKDNYPDDYKRITEFFPLIDIEILRYETD